MNHPRYGCIEEGRGADEAVLTVSIKNPGLDDEAFKASVRRQGNRDFPPECRIKYRWHIEDYRIVRAEILFVEKLPENVTVTE